MKEFKLAIVPEDVDEVNFLVEKHRKVDWEPETSMGYMRASEKQRPMTSRLPMFVSEKKVDAVLGGIS